jgi:hypothetical protein
VTLGISIDLSGARAFRGAHRVRVYELLVSVVLCTSKKITRLINSHIDKTFFPFLRLLASFIE